MSKGSAKTTSTSNQTQKTTPVSYLGTDTANALSQATALDAAGAPAYYPGQQVADLTPAQLEANQNITNLVNNGNPGIDDANSALQSILTTPSGTNPYLDQYLSTLGAQTANGINNTFNANGRFASGSNAATAATAVTNAQLPFLMNQYNTDQANKLTASQDVIPLSNNAFQQQAALADVGQSQQSQNQNVINADINKYNYNATAPENFLNNYLNQLNSSDANNWGTTTDNTTQTQSSKSGSVLGSLLSTGLALSSLFTGGATAPLAGLTSGAGLGSLIGSLFTPDITAAAGVAGTNGTLTG